MWFTSSFKLEPGKPERIASLGVHVVDGVNAQNVTSAVWPLALLGGAYGGAPTNG